MHGGQVGTDCHPASNQTHSVKGSNVCWPVAVGCRLLIEVHMAVPHSPACRQHLFAASWPLSLSSPSQATIVSRLQRIAPPFPPPFFCRPHQGAVLGLLLGAVVAQEALQQRLRLVIVLQQPAAGWFTVMVYSCGGAGWGLSGADGPDQHSIRGLMVSRNHGCKAAALLHNILLPPPPTPCAVHPPPPSCPCCPCCPSCTSCTSHLWQGEVVGVDEVVKGRVQGVGQVTDPVVVLQGAKPGVDQVQQEEQAWGQVRVKGGGVA
jgi:hypothetical protein